MSDFDDEIYTISDDSSSAEHIYVPKKNIFESLKKNKKNLIYFCVPLIMVVGIVLGIFFWPKVSRNPIVVFTSRNKPSNSSPSTNNHQSSASTTNAQQTESPNPVAGIVQQVQSLLQTNTSIPQRKPNFVAYRAGTDIQAQNNQNNQTVSNNSQSNPLGQQKQSQSQTNQNQQSASQNNPTPTPVNNNIQLVFKDPDGTIEIYQPPNNPPVDIVWARYVNAQDRYSIDYPSNWQMVKTIYNGHEGISLYLPNTTITQSSQFIGFGWAIYYLLPVGVNITTSYTSPISVGSVTGTLYTQGSLGYSYIASVFQYQNGYWGLGTSISDPTFAYVYNHMINSLVFNQ